MFIYNPDGSLTNATNDTFARAAYHKYSALPVSIVGSGGSASLCYDSAGRRAVKNGAVKVSYRRGIDGGIVPLSENVGGEDVIYIETPSGHRLSRSSKIYHKQSLDHLGSVRMRINAAECVSAMYSAYGDCNVTTPLRYTFTGYELDTETNLMNAWRRLYSPKLGRFVMVDPSLNQFSPYIYCDGDPFNFTDPTGESKAASIISGIVAGLILIASIVLTVVSEGSAAPLAGEIEMADFEDIADSVAVENLTDARVNLLIDNQAEASALPATKLGYSAAGGAIGASSSVVSNGASMVARAASGEHISARQAIRAMLIEPAMSLIGGFAGGFVTGAAILAFKGMALTVVGYVAGAAIASVTQSLLTSEAEREKIDGASLGISLGVAVGESLLLMPQFTAVHPAAADYIYPAGWFDPNTPVAAGDPVPCTVKEEILQKRVSTHRHRNGIHLTSKQRHEMMMIRKKYRGKVPGVRSESEPIAPRMIQSAPSTSTFVPASAPTTE